MMRIIKLFFLGLYLPLLAQVATETSKDQPQAPSKIEIRPTARDYEIQDRLEAILAATEWFKHTHVEVKEGGRFFKWHCTNSRV